MRARARAQIHSLSLSLSLSVSRELITAGIPAERQYLSDAVGIP